MGWLDKYTTDPPKGKVKNEFLDSQKVLDNLRVPKPKTEVRTDEEKAFMLEYINSDLYKQKLEKQGYKNPDQEIKMRAQNVRTVRTDYQKDKPNVFEQLYYKAIDKPYSTQGSQYWPKDHVIVMDNNTDKKLADDKGVPLNPKYIRTHELGHAELSNGTAGGNRLNENDRYELLSRHREYWDVSDQEIHEIAKRNAMDHDLKPDENKSDLNALRFMLKQKKIYDASKEVFTKEHLDKVPDNFLTRRILKNYKKEDIIWLMNNIASNDNKTNWLTKYDIA